MPCLSWWVAWKTIQVQMLEVIEVVVEPDVSLVICVIEDKIELSGPFLRQLSVTPKLGQHYPPPEEIGRTAVPEEEQAQFKCC